MSASPPLSRILARHGDGIVGVLTDGLAGSDLTSLLLEVTRRRAHRVTPAEVMRRFSTDRFVRPGAVPFAAVRWAEDRMIEALPAGVEVVMLAPLVPTGLHAVVAGVDQRNVVSTIRATDVAADPTTGLALEAVRRRQALLASESKSPQVVHLATVQRVTRAQRFDGALSFAHFTLGGMVSAGRDRGNHAFECDSVEDHVAVMARVVAATGLEAAWLEWTSFDPAAGRVAACAEGAARSMGLGWRVVGRAGRAYYRHFRFKLVAEVDGEDVDVGDGGDVDWGAGLLASQKERMLISGIGLERLAAIRSTEVS